MISPNAIGIYVPGYKLMTLTVKEISSSFNVSKDFSAAYDRQSSVRLPRPENGII